MAAFDAPAEMESRKELVEVRLRLHDIARAEITRHRKRLAELTIEQQSAVEALVISTADLICHQVIDRLQSYPEAVQKKCVSVWTGAAVP